MSSTVPPLCLTHLPVEIVRVVDGDTVDVRANWSSHVYRVRLLSDDGGCWAPEVKGLTRVLGIGARDKLREIITIRRGTASLFIPLGEGTSNNPLEMFTTLARILGRVYAGGKSLGEAMVEAGPRFATRTKDERLAYDAAWLKDNR